MLVVSRDTASYVTHATVTDFDSISIKYLMKIVCFRDLIEILSKSVTVAWVT